MAVRYFTTTADSGDGSLRDVIADAAAGDIIQPSPSLLVGSGPLVISLSSFISIPRRLTFEGGAGRVRLDGQKSTRLVTVQTSATVTFSDFDFVRGSNTSTGGCIVATTNGANIVLNRCLIAGNRNSTSLGDITTSSSSVRWSSVVCNDSILCGGSSQALSTARIDSYTLNRCTVAAYVSNYQLTAGNVDSIITNTSVLSPSDVGFLASPPDTIGAFDADAWTAWDFRLRPESKYLTGATTYEGTTDFAGHERGGSRGAFDGSYIIIEGVASASSSTSDYLAIEDGANVTLEDDSVLYARRSATIGDVDVFANALAFISSPSLTIAESANLSNVYTLDEFANVSDVFADTEGVYWTAEDNTKNVLIFQKVGDAWIFLAETNGGEYSEEDEFDAGDMFKLFDGFDVFTASVPVPPPTESYWLVKGWAVPSGIRAEGWAVAGSNGGGVDPETGETLPSWTVTGGGISPNF